MKSDKMRHRMKAFRVCERKRKGAQNNVRETTVKLSKLIKKLILITHACEHEQRTITTKASL